jgi:hypothetical protein
MIDRRIGMCVPWDCDDADFFLSTYLRSIAMRFVALALFSVLCVSVPCLSNNVYLKSGAVYRNVKVDTSGTGISIDMGSRIVTIPKDVVIANIPFPAGDNLAPVFELMTPSEERFYGLKKAEPAPSLEKELEEVKPEEPARESYYSRPRSMDDSRSSNAVFLTVGLLGAVMAWDNFTDAADYTKIIGDVEKSYDNLTTAQKRITKEPDVSSYENARLRSYVIGGVSALVGVAITIYALTPVAVTVAPGRVNVAYKF